MFYYSVLFSPGFAFCIHARGHLKMAGNYAGIKEPSTLCPTLVPISVLCLLHLLFSLKRKLGSPPKLKQCTEVCSVYNQAKRPLATY